MNAFKRYKWTWVLLAVCVIATIYLVYNSLGFGKEKFPIVREVAAYSMENVDGKTITSDDTKGKVKLMYFYFTSAGCMPDYDTGTFANTGRLEERGPLR